MDEKIAKLKAVIKGIKDSKALINELENKTDNKE